MVRSASIAAYQQICTNGLLTTRRLQVYEHLYNNGPCTGKEITLALTTSSSTSGSSFHGRLSELRELGVVDEVGEKKCQHTGQTVTLWDVNGNLPTGNISKGPTKLQQARADIKGLKQQLARRDILLGATYQLLHKQDNSPHVLHLLSETAVWDGVTCDGSCLMEEIATELNIKESFNDSHYKKMPAHRQGEHAGAERHC